MENRIHNAFDGVVLNEKNKEEIINNVIDGIVKESTVEGKKINFWNGKLGGAAIVAAAAVIFVVINLFAFGNQKKSTVAGEVTTGETEITQEAGTPEETKQQPETDAVEKTLADLIDISKATEIKLIDASTPEAALKSNYYEMELTEYDLKKIKISGENPDMDKDEPAIFSVKFYTDAETYDEWNIYSNYGITVNGIGYYADNGAVAEFAERIKMSILDSEKFQETMTVVSDDFTDVKYQDCSDDEKFELVRNYLPVKDAVMTCPYGEHYGNFHAGIDLVSESSDTNIYGMAGTVYYTGFDAEDGNKVIIDHVNGTMTEYLHLKEIYVKEGDTVQQGDIIGIMGKRDA